MDGVAVLLPGLNSRSFYQIFVVEFIPLFADLQFLRHQARDSIVILLIDLPLRPYSILIYPFWPLRLDALLSIPIRKTPSLLIPLHSHKRCNLAHPPISIHKLTQPTLLPMERHRVIQHANMQLRQVQLIHLLVYVIGLPLTSIKKLRELFVDIEVAVFTDQGM